MNKQYTSRAIAFRLWLFTAIIFSLGTMVYVSLDENQLVLIALPMSFIVALIGSLPAFFALLIFLAQIKNSDISFASKLLRLLLLQFFIIVLYALVGCGILAGFNFSQEAFLFNLLMSIAGLFTCSFLATSFFLRPVIYYFSYTEQPDLTYLQILNLLFTQTIKTNLTMEASQRENPSSEQSTRILIKGLITGGLILLMLIPTLFISNLIAEREARQKEVVKEVSSKWATAQNMAGPFLVVPYLDSIINKEGKLVASKTNILLLANDINVKGEIIPEQRPRSIYKVLLYKSIIDFTGNFKIKLPADIIPENMDFGNAKLCFVLSDFKGIEEEVYVNFNHEKLLLTPGLPVNDFGKVGLSVPVKINMATTEEMAFSMVVKIKGSEQLHFTPLSANSKYSLQSAWPNPSFDGTTLPGSRSVSDNGFSAQWNFNQANLPFGTVLRENTFVNKDDDNNNMAFGVSLIQPADQYNKTMRSVKYAILFIGLSFAFFFIIELMQRKPFHPVQYVLVGLALVIFYTLLLSISEYILFDYAYLIAAAGTILLITFYAKGHFQSWKTAAIFFGLLSCLYGFIFILIRLEDTALLVGSIGLFLVLALVMYVSRKINWYGNAPVNLEERIISN